jgi:hypothetical protein
MRHADEPDVVNNVFDPGIQVINRGSPVRIVAK